MNHLRLVLLTLVASAALAGSAVDRSDAAGTGPIATTSTAFLTTAEARQATRREVFRIARKQHEKLEEFEITWCRRRSRVRIGCRYTTWFWWDWRAVSCHGGARVVEAADGRRRTRAWRRCMLETDG
jgi:hypothetical protein